jgi:DMSO/TMAO reductase YedYZ molybdopterin-dependent catalytic subunit
MPDVLVLPPGQRLVAGFPRFGAHFHRPPPEVPVDPVIEIGGAVVKPFDKPLAELALLPRRELRADFHCVAGWSAAALRWEGVAFGTFYRMIIEPSVPPGVTVTHVVFEGSDGYRSIAAIEDAMAENVLLAEHLAGRPLDGDHGAPLRLVSPDQYGFMSTKHLCRIEVHTTEPAEHHHLPVLVQLALRLVKGHPRARVWQEERHRHLPAWFVRPLYRCLIPIVRSPSARAAEAHPR